MKRLYSTILILIALGFGYPLGAQTGGEEASALHPVPVIVDGKTLFFFKSGILSFNAEARARMTSERIRKVAGDPRIDPRSIRAVDYDDRTEIVADRVVLLIFTDSDAKVEGLEKSRAAIADYYVRRIQKAVTEFREARRPARLVLSALSALGITLLLILALGLLKFLFPRVYRRIEQWGDRKIKALQVQELEVVSAERARDLFIGAACGVRWVVTVLLLLLYLPLVLELFPWTNQAGDLIYSWIWGAVVLVGNAVWGYFPNLFIIALIVLVAHYVVKLCRVFFEAVERGRIKLKGVPSDLALMTFKLVRFLLWAFSVVVLYPYLPGAESAAFKGVSIFVGVLFSLGSTSVVANIFAGLSLTYMRAYQVGDRVKIGETVGDVIEIKMYGTRIRTIKNVFITIPNSQILQGPILNYSAEARTRGLILHTSVTIGYDAPWRTVHELLIEAAGRTRDILKNPPPFVLQTALNDFYITYELNAYTNQATFMARIYSDLHEHIQDTFNEAGVEIMSAHYLHLRDGSRTAVPDAYLPRDYEPRALRVYPNPTAGEESWRTGGKEQEK